MIFPEILYKISFVSILVTRVQKRMSPEKRLPLVSDKKEKNFIEIRIEYYGKLSLQFSYKTSTKQKYLVLYL